MKKQKIVLLVSHCPDALINKRILMLKPIYNVTVLYIERGNSEFEKIDGVDYKKLDAKFNNGKLFKRVFSLIKLKKQIRTIIKGIEPKVIYAFRLDMLLMIVTNGFKKKTIVYEVADLHETIINNSKNILKIIIKKILIRIEGYACKYVDMISITSEKYYDVYFNKFISKDKVVFMPNIPNTEFFDTYKKKVDGEFTIGYIGFVRYKEQMKMLIEAAERTKTYVFFAGASDDNEIKELAQKSKYVEYYGRYIYNTEIASLYSRCDCIYSVYDTKFNNVKYALPNKLYESIYCELPIIVAAGTYLGELVEKWNVGLTVDAYSVDNLVSKIEKLKNDKEYYELLVNGCIDNKFSINIDIYNDIFIKKLSVVEK